MRKIVNEIAVSDFLRWLKKKFALSLIGIAISMVILAYGLRDTQLTLENSKSHCK